MNKKHPFLRQLAPLLAGAALLLAAQATASIRWDSGTTNYTTGSTTLVADPTYLAGTFYGPLMGTYQGLEADFSANVPGVLNASGLSINFDITDQLLTGETVTMTLVMNMELFSSTPADNTASRRTAALFRVNADGETTTPLEGTSTFSMTGGNQILRSYVDNATFVDYDGDGTADAPLPPVAGAETITKTQEFSYNTGEASLGGARGTTVFDQIVDDNTLQFLTGPHIPSDSNQYQVAIFDAGRNTHDDFSFQTVTFSYTNTSADPLLAGTRFRITLDGMNPTEQLAILNSGIPEPSRALLLGAGALACLLLRRRRR